MIFGVIKSLFRHYKIVYRDSWCEALITVQKALYTPEKEGDGMPGTFLLQVLEWLRKTNSTHLLQFCYAKSLTS